MSICTDKHSAVRATVWLRDLSVLSYLSAVGVVASNLVVVSLFWVGMVDDHVNFHSKANMLNLGTLPVAIGLWLLLVIAIMVMLFSQYIQVNGKAAPIPYGSSNKFWYMHFDVRRGCFN